MFLDRTDAGRQLAEKFEVKDPANAVILALPRGGIPLAIEIALKFGAVLDVINAKKIAHPYQREYAIGALAERGEPLFNQVEKQRIEADWLTEEVERIRMEIQLRRELYDQLLIQQVLTDKEVIIVDDGIATGLTMYAAVKAVQEARPRSLAVAVPIIPKDTFRELERLVDEVYYLEVPEHFKGSVGAYFHSFPQLTNDEIRLMHAAYKEEQ